MFQETYESDESENESFVTLNEITFPLLKHRVRVHWKESLKELWLNVWDLCKALGSRLTLKKLTKKIECRNKSGVSNLVVESLTATHEWIHSSWVVVKESTDHEMYVSYSQLKLFLDWMLRSSRKTHGERCIVRNMFGFTDEVDEVSDRQHIPIAVRLLDFLQASCPYPIEREYRIDKYKLDGFIPRLRVAIEIDEHGHRAYDEQEEKTREQVIRDANMVLIRFNPHVKAAYSTEAAFVLTVWKRLIDPAFYCFCEKHQLR